MITIKELSAYNRKLVDMNLKLRKENENLKKRNSDEECLKRLAKKGYIKFCAKANEWHKVADGDLPNTVREVLVFMWDSYYLGYYKPHNGEDSSWHFNDFDEKSEEVIAWCEIPQYTEE